MRFIPQNCQIGDDVRIGRITWSCVIPCRVLGQNEVEVPILQGETGEVLNSVQLVPRNMLQTPGKKGQVPIEVLTLGQYRKIVPKEAAGKTVEFSDSIWGDVVLVIFDDKTYFKAVPVHGWDDPEMELQDLEMDDLRRLECIDVSTLAAYDKQKCQRRDVEHLTAEEGRLRASVQSLGIERANSILSAMVDSA